VPKGPGVRSNEEVMLRRLWLVGGGLTTPWTYERLAKELHGPIQVSQYPSTVAEVLFSVTRAIVFNKKFEVPELDGAGEVARWAHKGDLVDRADPDLARWYSLARFLSISSGQLVLRTSGSSGLPKKVVHAAGTLFRSVVRTDRHTQDVWGLAFNPTHIAGVQVYLQALANTNTLVNLWGLAPTDALARCRQWRVSHLSATPTYFRLLLAEGEVLSKVRSITVGGEPSDRELLERLQVMFPQARLHNVYASTEAGTLLSSSGVEFTIPPERTEDLAIRDGRIWVRRPLLGDFAGATEWYDTGDRVELIPGDAQRFRILGRERRVVNVGGEKIDPLEVEQALTSHPEVVLARVTGRKNSVTGEILTAVVVARNIDLSEQTLRHYLSCRLTPYKIPRLIRFVAELELTRTFKVRP
jgi:acyl-coenzyme A synthetase/AMP-(fatty) acid ligase